MRHLASVLFMLILIIFATVAMAEGLTIETLLDIEQVRSADISPDGELAAYTVSQNRFMDDPAGSAWSRLYVVATDGGDPRPFIIGQASVGSPHFSPDGKMIGFTMTRGEKAKSQVWAIPVNGGEARPATASPTGVKTWAWGHDGNSIFYVDTEKAPAEEKELKDKGWLPKVYEETVRGRILHRVTFAFGTDPGEAETLLEGMAVFGLNPGKTGRYLAFGASEKNLVDYQMMFQDIYLMDLATGEHRLLVDTPGKLGAYRLSPDESLLAWTGAASRSDHATSTLVLVDTDSGQQSNLTPSDFPGHIRSMTWRGKKTLLYLADESVYTTLSMVDVERNPSERKVIFDGKKQNLVVGIPAAHFGLKNMVFVGHNPTTPRELYAWNGKGAPKRLTHHNPGLAEVELSEQRVVRWTARDGLEIEGMLMMPVGTSGPAPLIVAAHGGPESNRSQGWLSRYAEPGQAFSTQGYAVFFPNYRGSTGRGIDFAASAYGDPAGKEFDDIVDGVDYLIAEGIADAGKVGVMGGSYGGYATFWLTTYYSDRFQAGVGMVGVTDLVSKQYLTDIPYENEYVHMGVAVKDSWDMLRERSPITYADKCQTPVLILHGENDTRVHPSQSLEMYRALKMEDHPSVRLIYYPGEGHGNRKRFGREDFVYRALAWMDYYLKDGKAWDGPMPPADISEEMGLMKED